MGSKRLYRTEGSYKMLCGVCGGLAEYFDLDLSGSLGLSDLCHHHAKKERRVPWVLIHTPRPPSGGLFIFTMEEPTWTHDFPFPQTSPP